ncbi:rab GTPase-binding effector protein 1 [Achroia grisella]|uniref:rab GTPase-binding effector protein 1 n=1 Tax=Achroia grisella TaxID=688607 RepID=UPI0027D2C3C3|nr:rab GTPase-binding effector protein 1 [Achroia grisella]
MSNETAEMTKAEAVGERTTSSPDQMRRELEEEFNVQRAKMKELFLQKEEDMRKMSQDKQQLESEVVGLRDELQQLETLAHNQKSEIQNLQLLVSETLEASSSGSEELRRLRARNLELEQQIHQLNQLNQQRQQQEMSLAPATFVRSLARKLGADAEADQPAKKFTEDSELMQSIIQPLNDEIVALKAKLRDTDCQLQEALQKVKSTACSSPATLGSGGEKPSTEVDSSRQCDMCANYEKQLVSEQAAAEAANDRATTLDRALKLATEELEGVRALQDESARAWAAGRAAAAGSLSALRAALGAARAALAEREAAAAAAQQRVLLRVTDLTVHRETLQRKLDTLEKDNATLIGQYMKKAAEMQNEIINLPDNVEELQEHVLQVREQLILCQIGREEANDAERELRAQLQHHAAIYHRQDEQLAAQRGQLAQAREQLDCLQTEREQMKELGDKLRHSNDMIEGLLEDKKRLQAEVQETRGRVSVLQQELDNSEKVQQDFVRLSQSLQVQLQRIREADTEVRWQHDEDVNECPSCHTPLQTSKKKVHCRHCGRIFCASCASHSVASGPRRAPARVCAVCRTLLQPHAAPYFSTEPPRRPD